MERVVATKECTRCEHILPKDSFYEYEKGKTRNICKKCHVKAVTKNPKYVSRKDESFKKDFVDWNNSAIYC